MNKLKDGANYVGSNVKSVSTTATTKTKQLGGATTKNLKSIGTNFKDFGEKYTEKLHKHEYSSDEELITHYHNDLVGLLKGLKMIKFLINKLTNSYYPSLFKINESIAIYLIKLIGENSLNFAGIETFYQDWDKYNSNNEVFQIHPQEKNFTINSINLQLVNYFKTLQDLKLEILDDWKLHTQSLIDQINQAIKYIKNTLNLIKLWFKKKLKCDILIRNIDSLNNKSVLSDKNQQDMSTYQIKLQEAQSSFEKINHKTKSILPHFFNFLDEFVDTITKILFLKQCQTMQTIANHFEYFVTFYGEFSKNHQNIVEDWENSFTPTKIQIESFISILYNKKPELIDQEVDDKDQSSKITKMVDKMTGKMTNKTFQFKGDDLANGAFDGYLAADPLDSYIKYYDYGLNRSQTYHPKKMIPESELIVIPANVNKDVPPLPPRSNIVENKLALPLQLPKTPLLSQRSSVISPVNRIKSPLSPTFDQLDRYDNYLDESDEDDISSSSSSIMSESEYDASSLSTQDILRNSNEDYIERELIKVYNSDKNEIKIAPTSKTKTIQVNPHSNIETPTTITHKLDEYQELFNRLINHNKYSETRTAIAKLDFDGQEPGDLSFKSNDAIEILFDFQSAGSLYKSTERNWLIGLIKSSDENYRVGFVPNNYLSL